jgi:hypothetical protein
MSETKGEVIKEDGLGIVEERCAENVPVKKMEEERRGLEERWSQR